MSSCDIFTSTKLHEQFGFSRPGILYSLLVYRLFSYCFFYQKLQGQQVLLEKTKNKEKQHQPHHFVGFFFLEVWLSMLKGTKAGASVQHHYKGQPLYLTTDVQAMFMHFRSLFECKSIQKVFSIIEQLYASSLKFRTFISYWQKSTHFPLELNHKNSRQIPAPHLLHLFVYSLPIDFILTPSPRNDINEKIWCKILAGCCCITAEMRRACCHVWSRSFKTLKSTVISSLLRI